MFAMNKWPCATAPPLLLGTILEPLGITVLASALNSGNLHLIFGMLALTGVGTGIRLMPGTLHGIGYFPSQISHVVSLMALANTLGGFLAPLLLVGLAHCPTTWRSWRRWPGRPRIRLTLFLAGLILVAYCLLLTKSRSGWIAVGVGMLVILVGQRGRGRNARLSLLPSRSLSRPAQATMAPLSVQSCTGGAANGIAFISANLSRRLRKNTLAATPPATTNGPPFGWRFRNISRAFSHRSASTSLTACWKDAQRSAMS